MSLVASLMAVGEQAFGDDALGILAADDLRVALGGVDAADLHGVHLLAPPSVPPPVQVLDGLGLFRLSLSRLLAVMAGGWGLGDFCRRRRCVRRRGGSRRSRSCGCRGGDDVHVAVLADVEVVVDHLGKAGLADDDGDVALLALRAGLDADDDAALAIRLGDDLNMLGGLAGLAAAVLTDVERAHGLAREVGDLSRRRSRYRSAYFRLSFLSGSARGRSRVVSAMMRGKTSSVVPRCLISPPPTTMISSAS